MAYSLPIGFAPVGVEMSQPTKVISVTTIIPSQNLRYTSCSLRRSSSGTVAYINVCPRDALTTLLRREKDQGSDLRGQSVDARGLT